MWGVDRLNLINEYILSNKRLKHLNGNTNAVIPGATLRLSTCGETVGNFCQPEGGWQGGVQGPRVLSRALAGSMSAER